MNEYIFYTSEGFTEPPDGNCEVDNCQMLGRANGVDAREARKKLLEENPWIEQAGFDPGKFFVKRLLTDEQRSDIRCLVEYLLSNEKFHWAEDQTGESHILDIIERLRKI